MAFLQNFTNENFTSASKLFACGHDAPTQRSLEETSIFVMKTFLTAMSSTYSVFVKNFYCMLLVLVAILLLYFIYKVYFNPICYVKELAEVGFEHIPAGRERRARIARAQALRRQGGSKLPPPYPNGWFAVAESRDLKRGGVLAVDVLGQNLCVYRGEDGVARVVDAYCPHLGANLGVGGTVRGDCIECPFHKWKFDAGGACVAVPGADQAPKGVSVRSWASSEAEGAVWVWHDAEGREPQWALQDAPECRRWGYRGRNEFLVSAHIQEIPENGADVAHLNAVHSLSLLSRLGEKYPFLKDIIGQHVWRASWSSNGDHSTHIALSHHYQLLSCELFRSTVQINQIGPGHVRLRMQTPVGPFLLSQSVTPVGPLLQRVTNRLFSPACNAGLAWLIILGEGKMIERDVQIWNSKRFVSSPAYVKTDRTIRAFRAWYSQFYSPHSVSYKDAVRSNLDW